MTTLEYLKFALATALDVYQKLPGAACDASRRAHIFDLQRRVREEAKRERRKLRG